MKKQIKFNKYNVTDGTTKARIFYSIGNRADGRKCVNLYHKDWNRALGKIFTTEYQNETDAMIDYFDQGHVTLFEDHPLYQAALKRALSNRIEQAA